MTQWDAGAELAHGLDTGAASAELADRLDAVIAAGLLAPDPSQGVLRPVPSAALAAPRSATWWRARGFVPYRVKPLALARPQANVLAAALTAVRDLPELRAVPVWWADGVTISFERPGAMDLRAAVAGSAEAAERARECALESLARFAAHDARLSEAVAALTPEPAPDFPVAQRLVTAVGALRDVLGAAAANEIPALDVAPEGSARMLFNDPKAANFLVMQPDWPGDGPNALFRVDLDLMRFRSTVCLQAAIAVFSAPLIGPVEALLGRGRRFAAGYDADRAEFDAVVCYHVVRNFTSAAQAGDLAKAHAFARVLEECAALLVCLGDTRELADGVLRWRRAHPLLPTASDVTTVPSRLRATR